ncbi:class I SAM-dependent methyltransferase [Immundisolibacter sp.]|uniref:class I SAM-dependent methyltransferase n=1 Tax=Immundisolibacter sp. TaxID=1934948 RepID=UPI0026075CD9|nr:class I SAM-dependent methyltransferase [Immundisolibacter sp.]MDD3651873.1 class I SAM-dependent methyltransferase [Immundisolibacter sp.]
MTAAFPWLAAAGYALDAATGCWLPAAARVEFPYTDGEDVEAELLALLRATADRSVLSPALRAAIRDWPTHYHLSPRRANLLRPLEDWLRGRAVLEVGAGCGAITRYLGECGARVLALEGSPRRAAVAAARCAGLENVAVVADRLQDFAPAERFDVVTLIGVLEYARQLYADDPGPDPVAALLERARHLLRADGVLLVAIENQLGLKYFAGCAEDHEAAPMVGIEDRYRADGAVTFGRAELGARLAAAGLASIRWWYPFPDYKLPVAVLSEAAVSGAHGLDLTPLAAGSVTADPQLPPAWHFSLEQAWRTVLRNGLGGELANSFLVAAATAPGLLPPVPALAHHYAAERRPGFAKGIAIHAADPGARHWWRRRPPQPARVLARRLDPAAPVPDVPLHQHLEAAAFAPGQLWHGRLLEVLNQPGWTAAAVADWLGAWLDHLARHAGIPRAALAWDTRLDGRLVDAVPRNLMVAGDRGTFIDLEWELVDGLDFGHLCYRGLMLSLLGVSSCAPPAGGQPIALGPLGIEIMGRCGYAVGAAELAPCHAAERRFQEWVHGGAWIGFCELLLHAMPVRGGRA